MKSGCINNKEGSQMISSSSMSKEKYCKEFFPNCNCCSVFDQCFPTNGLNDEMSEIALLDKLGTLEIKKSRN